jgi:subtilisin family serine protease
MPLPVSLPPSHPGSGCAGWHLVDLGIDILHNQNVTGAGIRVAVIDTGVYRACPALQHAAIDAYDRDGNAGGDDHHGHGTSMSVILVGEGIGVCPDAHVLSIRALSSSGLAGVGWLVKGIDAALVLDAEIINISAGQHQASQPLVDAVKRATDRGVVVVAAADNDDPYAALYPACAPSAIAVTASNARAAIVHPGSPGWVDLAAPGVNIATYVFDTPAPQSGTSEATAIVSGVCALLLGEVPRSRRPAAAQHLLGFLTQTAKRARNATGPGQCGIVHPAAALAAIQTWQSS